MAKAYTARHTLCGIQVRPSRVKAHAKKMRLLLSDTDSVFVAAFVGALVSRLLKKVKELKELNKSHTKSFNNSETLLAIYSSPVMMSVHKNFELMSAGLDCGGDYIPKADRKEKNRRARMLAQRRRLAKKADPEEMEEPEERAPTQKAGKKSAHEEVLKPSKRIVKKKKKKTHSKK